MNRLFLLLVLGAIVARAEMVAPVPDTATTTSPKLIFRTYSIHPAVFARLLHTDQTTNTTLQQQGDPLRSSITNSVQFDKDSKRDSLWRVEPQLNDFRGTLDVKSFLAKFGVQWPEQSIAVYNKRGSRLSIYNTENNLDLIEKVISRMNVQVELIRVTSEILESSNALSAQDVSSQDLKQTENKLLEAGSIRKLFMADTVVESGLNGVISSKAVASAGKTLPTNIVRVRPVVGPDGYSVFLDFDADIHLPQEGSESSIQYKMESAFTVWDGESIRVLLNDYRADKRPNPPGAVSVRYLKLSVLLLDPAGNSINPDFNTKVKKKRVEDEGN